MGRTKPWKGLKRHSITTRLNIRDISGDYGRNYEGRELLHWKPTDHGRVIELGTRTTAWHFEADHITGASGWRVECDGKAVVFSGDTRYSPEVVKAAEGADLLIHEAFCVADTLLASSAGHCTSGRGRPGSRRGPGGQPRSHPPYRPLPRRPRTSRRGSGATLSRPHHHRQRLHADHPLMSDPTSGIEVIFLGTGAGMSITRAHTAIALRCPDGTTLLLDGSSGNSALRNGAGGAGLRAPDYDHVLLSQDHLSGLLFIQGRRTHESPEENPTVDLRQQHGPGGPSQGGSGGKGCPTYATAPPTTTAAGRSCAGRKVPPPPRAGAGAGHRGLVIRRRPHPRLGRLAH